MPNIKSAKKRVLVSKRRNAENTAKKSRVKTAVKKYNAAIAAGDVALAEQLLPATVSVIDRATSDFLIFSRRSPLSAGAPSRAVPR